MKRFLAAILLCVAASPSLAGSRSGAAAAGSNDSVETRNVAVVTRLFNEGFSGGNLGVLDEVLAPDFVFSDPNLPPGIEGLKAIVKKNNTAFEDWTFVLHDTIAKADKVVVRWTASGKHVNPFLGEQPTGEIVKLSGISIYRLHNGLIEQDWVIPDNLGFLTALRVIEPVKIISSKTTNEDGDAGSPR